MALKYRIGPMWTSYTKLYMKPNNTTRAAAFSSKVKSNITDSVLPKNELAAFISADKQTENGVVYDKKPFKITLVAGKRYSWCLCGRSKTQPLCDGTHRMQELRIKQKPIAFQVAETKDYWLCNCKQTRSRPFCDGTHKLQQVQEANSIVRTG